jgi:hypothetical protein
MSEQLSRRRFLTSSGLGVATALVAPGTAAGFATESAVAAKTSPRPCSHASIRVPPELVFDRGIGDLAVIRTGAQVLDEGIVQSRSSSPETFWTT